MIENDGRVYILTSALRLSRHRVSPQQSGAVRMTCRPQVRRRNEASATALGTLIAEMTAHSVLHRYY